MKKKSEMNKFETSKLVETHSIVGGKWTRTDGGSEVHAGYTQSWCCDIYNDETRTKVLYGGKIVLNTQ